MNPEDDTRNLIDRYKGKSNEEIVTDLDKKRTPIENRNRKFIARL